MPYFDPQLFAAAVRNKRGDLSLRDVAAILDNVSASTLSRIEAGEEPSLRTFFVLCEWMRADPLEFTITAVGKVAELERRVTAIEAELARLRPPVYVDTDEYYKAEE
jgi:transcriptional regulator with XRE-family HTH domain